MSPDAHWTGIFPAALTMFDGDDRIDESATVEHLEFLIGQGAHGLVVAGTSGEFVGLTPDERILLFEIAVDVAKGRVPIIGGTGWYSTNETIRFTERAAATGIDGAIVILPYFHKPTENELLTHFRAVGRAAPLPVMIYNNPTNSAAPPLQAHHLRTLYEEGVAHGVKSTFPTVHQVHEVVAATDTGFRTFYGSFMAPLEGLAGGAHGWISGILNVVTADAVELWTAVQQGELARAREVWNRILPIKYLYTQQQLGPISDLAIYRGILNLRGHTPGHCRAPLSDLSAEQVRQLEALLADRPVGASR